LSINDRISPCGNGEIQSQYTAKNFPYLKELSKCVFHSLKYPFTGPHILTLTLKIVSVGTMAMGKKTDNIVAILNLMRRRISISVIEKKSTDNSPVVMGTMTDLDFNLNKTQK
jgi:hypothetical protein